MAAWSHSPFLQALGWAMLNSFWQMAVLFLAVSFLQRLMRLSSAQKYHIALASLGVGFCWFVYTFLNFYYKGADGTLVAQHRLAPTSQTWNLLLSSASVVYLLLLLLPATRLFRNWRYIEHLKKFGLQKTAMEYRLFVKKVAQHLGIKPTVHVYLSQLVQSPVTIGYLKPIILLPIAAFNHLNPQQVEAVLLHELSHIRRYDYLINFMVTLLQTLFYFNPFVKFFVSQIEFEREKCCDELVLQFGYDNVSYAAALLQLEKNVLATEVLAVAAAGKNHLLHRIEKIVGVEKKSRFTVQQFAGLLASFAVVLIINSLLIVKKEATPTQGQTFTAIENPLVSFDAPSSTPTFSKPHVPVTERHSPAIKQPSKPVFIAPVQMEQPQEIEAMPVTYDAVNDLVSADEKAQIAQTIETTKKVLTESKWKEVEASIGDGLTANEKQAAKKMYLKELSKVNWRVLEDHLKTKYDALNWTEITGKLNGAIAEMHLDSLQTVYRQVLTELQKTQAHLQNNTPLPVPDASLHQINALQSELRSKIDSIIVIREKKVVDF